MGKPMKISYAELSTAYSNFLKLAGYLDPEGLHYDGDSGCSVQNRISEFEKFIEHKLIPPTLEALSNNEGAVAKIKWMSSPHAETLYKAWKAKHTE
jgi:hypothetical protein